MDPRRLLTFRAVAHCGSFSRAAEQLSLTQPSVSNQIAQLEAEVGVRLLDRGRGGVRLTTAGETLLTHADDIAWRLGLADRQLGAVAAEHRDRLRLGAFPSALAGFVPAAVSLLRDSHHDLSVELSEVTASALESRLLRGDFDVALGYQDATVERREIRGAERIDILIDTFSVGLPSQHRVVDEPAPVSLVQLADDDWIFPSRDGFLVQACRDLGFEPQIVATTAGTLATRSLIARGVGVGLVPSLLADEHAGIAVRPIKENILKRQVYALLPPGRHHPRGHQLIRALTSAAADFGRPD